MTAVAVEELSKQVAQVRDNPGLPYEASKNLSLGDIAETMAATRTALAAAVESAPDSAFEEQPANAEGEEVWSVGQIVGHCNSALLSIGGEALKLIGIEAGEPPETLVAHSESKIMSRDEAVAAANAVDTNEFFAMIPDDGKLDETGSHDFFGNVSGRSWLYFMAMHEGEHVVQVRALS